MEYILEDRKFNMSYQELKESYNSFCDMPDQEFLLNLPKAAHLACVISYLKEVPAYICISDLGIIHELIHLMDEGTTTPLNEIRNLFRDQLELK